MLKTENLKLVNDLKIACIFDVEKKKAWEKEAIKAKVLLDVDHYKMRFVPQKRGFGYGLATTSPSAPHNVPNVVPRVSTCNGPLGTSKLQSSEGKGIDFVKQKKYKPFRSSY